MAYGTVWQAARFAPIRGLIFSRFSPQGKLSRVMSAEVPNVSRVPFGNRRALLAARVVEHIGKNAAALGCAAELEDCRTIAACGTSADRQLAVYEAAYHDTNHSEALRAVTDRIGETTLQEGRRRSGCGTGRSGLAAHIPLATGGRVPATHRLRLFARRVCGLTHSCVALGRLLKRW
jgi:hypothetical protein